MSKDSVLRKSFRWTQHHCKSASIREGRRPQDCHLRSDLVPRITSGELTLNTAMALIEPKPRPSSYDKLVGAWNRAAYDDRQRLLTAISGSSY